MPDTPNAASVALLDGDKVLLIQRAYAPYQHFWTLPGGRLELGETIDECARREVHEELGLTIAALRPVLVQTLTEGKTYRLAVFASTDFSGDISPSDEIEDHRWVTIAEMSALPTTANLDAIVREAFALFTQ